MKRSLRQRINKAMEMLNDTIEQLNLIDIFRTLHPKKPGYTFFSSAHGAYIKINHLLGQKANSNKFKILEITQCSLKTMESN